MKHIIYALLLLVGLTVIGFAVEQKYTSQETDNMVIDTQKNAYRMINWAYSNHTSTGTWGSYNSESWSLRPDFMVTRFFVKSVGGTSTVSCTALTGSYDLADGKDTGEVSFDVPVTSPTFSATVGAGATIYYRIQGIK